MTIKRYCIVGNRFGFIDIEESGTGDWVKHDDHLAEIKQVKKIIKQRNEQRPTPLELLAKDLRDGHGIQPTIYTLTVERDGLPQEAPVDFEFESVLLYEVECLMAQYRPLCGETRITIQINERQITLTPIDP